MPDIDIKDRSALEQTIQDLHAQIAGIKAGQDRAIADAEGFRQKLADINAAQKLGNAATNAEDRDCARALIDLSRDAEVVRGRGQRDVLRSGNHAIALSTISTPTREIPGLLDSHNPSPWQRRLQEAVTRRNAIRARMPQSQLRQNATPKCDAAIADILRECPIDGIRKAFNDEQIRIFADASGIGAETIFDFDMPELERKIDLNRSVASLFDVMPVSSNTVVMPYQTRRLRPYKGGVVTADDPPRFNASTIGLADRTYNLAKMVIRTQTEDDASEDSFLDVEALMMDELAQSYLLGEEDAIINGDTAASHQDAINAWDIRSLWGSDNAGALDHRTTFLGLRARAYDASNTTDRSSTAIVTALRTARGTLKAPHGMDAVHLVSYETFVKHLQSAEDFKTLDKFGNLASRLSGSLDDGPLPNQIGQIDGAPVIVSWLLSSDLATSGLYTGSGTTSGALTISRNRFMLLQRRNRRMESQRDVARGVNDHVLTARVLFAQKPGDNATTDKLAHFLFNIT